MKVVLCGYNWAGCKALDILLNRGYEVFVYTHKNPSYVNSLIEYCKKLNIQYSTDKITIDNLPFAPDIISSVYYRYIISNEIIKLVNKKIFNLHPSLLPKYKGCGSLTWAMINGEKEVGFTFHYINIDIDTGNIILQQKIAVEEFDTQQTLYNRVMFKSMEKYENALDFVLNNYIGIPQNSLQQEFYYKRGCPYNGQIHPNWDNNKIERFIRAMNFPPLPYAKLGNVEIQTMCDYLSIESSKESL